MEREFDLTLAAEEITVLYHALLIKADYIRQHGNAHDRAAYNSLIQKLNIGYLRPITEED